eukprot:797724-Prymnesium_polylepis.1
MKNSIRQRVQKAVGVVAEAYVMYTYGGVYADADTQFVKSLDSLQCDYDSLAENVLNPIVIVSAPKMKIWRQTLTQIITQ